MIEAANHTGWLRPSGKGRWLAVTTGATDAEAFRKLQEAAKVYRFVDLLTLPAGQDPNDGRHRGRVVKGSR
jgi:hypothetical protein